MFRIITKNLAGRITKNLTVVSTPPEASPFYPVLPYSSLSDSDLLEPGAYDIEDVFIPAASFYSEQLFYIQFKHDGGVLVFGDSSSLTPGGSANLPSTTEVLILPTGLFFHTNGDRGFALFADSTNDGLKTIIFSKNSSLDNLGGEVRYYFRAGSFPNVASEDNATEWGFYEIYQNGSVYRRIWNNLTDTLGDPSLLCRWDGAKGPAGGGVAVDTPRPMISSLPASPYTSAGDGLLNNPGTMLIEDVPWPCITLPSFIPVLGYYPTNTDALQIYFSIDGLIWGSEYFGGNLFSDIGSEVNIPKPDYQVDGVNVSPLSGFTIGAEFGLHNHPETNDNFADSSLNGLKAIYFSKSDNEDGLGGLVNYYYHHDAWVYACDLYFAGTISAPTNISVLEVYQNGSVYVRDRNNPNAAAILVVRWDGEVGPGGSATPDVLVDIPRPI